MSKFVDKLPDYQLLFKDKEAFTTAYKLILNQIIGFHNGQTEKARMHLILKKTFSSFFQFEYGDNPEVEQENTQLFGYYTEAEMKALTFENFLPKRLENINMTLEELLKKMHEEASLLGVNDGDDKSFAKLAKGRAQRPARGAHNKKIDKKGEQAVKAVSLLELSYFQSKQEECSAFIGLSKEIPTKENSNFLPTGSSKNILYASVHFYSFFRQFHCLYERLIKAKALAASSFDLELEKRQEFAAKYAQVLSEKNAELKAERYEKIYLKGLCSLLRGSVDAAKYEDFCKILLRTTSISNVYYG